MRRGSQSAGFELDPRLHVIGFVVYLAFLLGTGRHRELTWMGWVLGGLFLADLLFQ